MSTDTGRAEQTPVVGGNEEFDSRIEEMRWCKITRSNKAHLWLGNPGTACGLCKPSTGNYTVTAYGIPARNCAACEAYARGWLDRHDTGASPRLEQPSPFARRGVPDRS